MSDQPTAPVEAVQLIKVLLVEDHTLTRIGLKAALKRTKDISVVGEASNGKEAVETAALLSPDVILMDVGMPVMDGIQAAKKILDNHPKMKVIMLTQHDNDQDILASLAAGASGYCLKDVEPERLYTAIRSVRAGDAWIDAAVAGRVLRYYTRDLPAAKIAPSSQSTKFMEKAYIEPLSTRELDVLRLIVDGLSNQEIANKLVISLATAKTHVRNILNKLSVDDRTQAAVHAMRHGLL